MKKRVLGRGLEALIPEAKPVSDAPVNEIDIDRIVRNPSQPRLRFDEARLEELVASIRQNGVLQPILVRPFEQGYQLIAGERRLSAAQRAGLLKIPATVREVPDDLLLELALIENIQREPLNAIEEAQAYQKLIETTSATQEQIADRLGKDRSTIANSVRLLKLPPSIRSLIAEGKFSPGHARALLASGATPSEMAQTAALIIERDWSVRETERWAQHRSKAPALSKIQDPNEVAAADRLRMVLGAKVDIHAKTKEKGEIRIYYYSQEELMRLYTILANKAIPTEPRHAIQEGKRG
jgi:ParB family transcriptional regulator, chromosome partitioning protein